LPFQKNKTKYDKDQGNDKNGKRRNFKGKRNSIRKSPLLGWIAMKLI